MLRTFRSILDAQQCPQNLKFIHCCYVMLFEYIIFKIYISLFQYTPYRFTVRQKKREVAVQSRTSSKITVQSLIAENLVTDKSNQTAICHVKESKIAHTSGFIHFLQKCSIVKLEETMLQFSTFFSTAIKKGCLPHAPTNNFCGNFAIARHACLCKSNQR